MDKYVQEEAAKIHALSCWSEFEFEMAGEIAEWIMFQPKKFDSMRQACNAYWYERLNQ